MKLPKLKIRNLESEYPVIQAGMGVRVGNYRLAAETILQGGFGTIASVGLGDIEKSKMDFVNENKLRLDQEIKKARELSGNKKPLGVNIMVALSIYEESVRQSIESGIDFIISGAGLPIPLPEYVGDADVALIPVISGGRALKIVLNAWKRKYNRIPDAIVIEGAGCGGHLGFSYDELKNPESRSLEILLQEVTEIMDETHIDIPLIAAGEVASRQDIERLLEVGYDGVQIGTKFIATDEADMAPESKQLYVDSSNDDAVVIESPVGLPVRVIKTPLVERVLAGNIEHFGCPYRCLRTCNPQKAPFCIAKALLSTWSGDVDNGLYMTGCNLDALDKVIPLAEFFSTLKD
ncbi:MAG: nitronate monooxygenase [Proteobacteria bacterium]|nr:nitronate monooxygenase [Pseudomonadota bacterium]